MVAKVMALLVAVAIAQAALAQSAEWLLMSRHGECTDASRAVRHKFQDITSIAGPAEFADEMKRRGHTAKVSNGYGGNRNAVLVEVPERELSLLFVKRELCREFTLPR